MRHAFMPRQNLLSLSVGLTLLQATGAFAQNTGPATTPTNPTVPVTTPTTTPPTTNTDATTAVGSTLVQPRAAVPTPNPNLASNAAMPDQRGFIRAEPFFIYPYVAVGAGHNDNLIGTKDNKISSSYALVSPRVVAEARSGANRYQLSYSGNYGSYFSSHADDFNEHELVARTVNQFTTSADLTASAYYLNKIDPRGSTTRASSDVPDKWRALGASGTFGYGARSGPGRFEVDLGVTDKKYVNNESITSAFDVTSLNIGGRFYYRIAPRTRLLVELRDTEYDYKQSGSPLDSSEKRLLTGATWDLAAATTGTVKVGYFRKTFKTGGFADISGASVDAVVRWLPRTYSTIDLLLSRSPQDSTGVGTSTTDTLIAAVWNHKWQTYVSTRVTASYLDSKFNGFSRTDKTASLAFGGYFDIRTWLRFGLEISHANRDSSIDSLSYKRNVVMLTAGATL